jgi:hypothetical protein
MLTGAVGPTGPELELPELQATIEAPIKPIANKLITIFFIG